MGITQRIGIIGVVLMLIALPAIADSIFLGWHDRNSDRVVVYRVDDADTTLSNVRTPDIAFVLAQDRPLRSMASDQVSRRLYLALESPNEIVSFRPDGGDQQVIATYEGQVLDLKVDQATGLVYWLQAQGDEDVPGACVIRRIAPGDADPVTIEAGTNLVALAIDPDGQKLYRLRKFIDGQTAYGLFRSDLDGSNDEDLSGPLSVYFDAEQWPNTSEPKSPFESAGVKALSWDRDAGRLSVGFSFFDASGFICACTVLASQRVDENGDLIGNPTDGFFFGFELSNDVDLFATDTSESTGERYTLTGRSASFTDVSVDNRHVNGALVAQESDALLSSRIQPDSMAVLPSVATCSSDLDLSGTVDFDDLVLSLFWFDTANEVADCDGSGVVGFDDLVCMLMQYGCESPGSFFHDCDGDGLADAARPIPYDAEDCNGNGLLDACEIASNPDLDCNGDGYLDNCDGNGMLSDCNGNGNPDVCDIADGFSFDCDGNGVPDECDPDCNGNGIADACDIADGFSSDCNGNGVPDECEPDCNGNGIPDACDIADGFSSDCNGNRVPDECDIAGGASADINTNGIPDECEADCNTNGIPDEVEISDGSAMDCNENGVPDECETDCNGNGIPDECDISGGLSSDCNANGVPDECEPDCNGNGVPDECDIAGGFAQDCNGNGIPDECDIASGSSTDCNMNGVPDDCDIASGTSEDNNGNGLPDECDVLPTLISPQDNAVVNTLTPTLMWMNPLPFDTAVIIFPAQGGAPVHIQTGLPQAGPYTVPAGVLLPGRSYTWRIAVNTPDGVINSETRLFTTATGAN